MSRKGNRSDVSEGSLFGLLVVGALLWWLRWIIFAAVVTAVFVAVIWGLVRWYIQLRAARLARLEAIRKRAEIQNAQVLRGDPAGFFGQYPLPDPELIPAWYTIDPSRRRRRRGAVPS